MGISKRPNIDEATDKEKIGGWRIMDQYLESHKKRRSRRSNRRFFFGKIDISGKLPETCLFKVRFDLEKDGFNAVDVHVAVQGVLNRYQTQRVNATKASCVRTFCNENEAIINATLNGEYLSPKKPELILT